MRRRIARLISDAETGRRAISRGALPANRTPVLPRLRARDPSAIRQRRDALRPADAAMRTPHDVVAPFAERCARRFGHALLDHYAPPFLPPEARRIDRALDVETVVEEVDHQLHVPLRLHESAADP